MTDEREQVAEAAPVQSADQPRSALLERAAWVGAWAAVVALAVWTQQLSLVWSAVAAAGTLLWTLGGVRRRAWWSLAAMIALWAGVGAAVGIQIRLHEIATEWAEIREAVEERAAEALRGDLDELVDRGERAVEGAAGIVSASGDALESAFVRLEALRRRTGMSALAVFGSEGDPLVWAGEHRGSVPFAVRSGQYGYFFGDGPLFGYLYFIRRLDTGRTAVAAVLLDASVQVGGAPFAASFAERYGITPRFTLPERAQGESIWDWATDRPIFSVSFATLTQEGWRDRVARNGRWAVVGALVLGFVLLGIGWYRRHGGSPGVPVVSAALALFFIPWGQLLGAEELFSPLRFVLPVPGDITLGGLLLLLTGAAVWLLARAPRGGIHLPMAMPTRIAAGVLVVPVAVALIEQSAAGGVFTAATTSSIALHVGTVLLIALPLFLLLSRRSEAGRVERRVTYDVAAVLISAALVPAVVALWRPGAEIPVWVWGLWGVPFLLFLLALGESGPGWRTLRTWLAAAWLAGTATFPALWVLHIDARLAAAEREIARLGTEADPFLDFLLRQFADRVRVLAAEGEEGVSLLYQSWVSSGMAAQGYEARMTIWEMGAPRAELQLSGIELPPGILVETLDEARRAEAPVLRRYTRIEDVHYLLMAPLAGGRVVSVVVPPRRSLGRATALARFLDRAEPGGVEFDRETLSLIPIPDEQAGAGGESAGDAIGPESVLWVAGDAGWRSEALVDFPSGLMHAHMTVRTEPAGMRIVRGLLVQAVMVAFLFLLWGMARTLCGDPLGLPRARWTWLRSFRGRLTLTLFAFFLLPTLAFAAIGYGTLSQMVVRTARTLALASLEQAARDAPELPLPQLASHVQRDLLLYRNGVLLNASAPEVLDLGLFHTWLSPDIYLSFRGGEEIERTEERRLGANEYIVAYRRMDTGEVLAVPTPLASGEIARRRRELADITLLIALIGAGLSVVLSVFVGRALSRPIEELSGAAAAVGSGNLRIRLPEDREDEFGGVYRSFNRMVRRLRRARGALVRETRRTEAIVAEAGTGVLALDNQERVALVNARAGEILGAWVRVGDPLPPGGGMLGAVNTAIQDFWRAGTLERAEEIEMDGRVVRLRLRRLASPEGRGGAVLALEDITAEIRSARVLAWGEMARQVAHEIKNPLTPIKLAVQHIRRAYTDRRGDFADILERNVDAVLREIDRLGEIARAFSRFGTPDPTAGMLEIVDVREAVGETLALYRGGDDGVDYRAEVPPGTPAVLARMGELKEVLVNLLENAREALNGGGEIVVRAAPDGAGRVEVAVTDTGEGIPAESLLRIFEPQFSTRSSGTGLGLAIVRRLVESWGGEVTAESKPGAGTTVRLRLQAAE